MYIIVSGHGKEKNVCYCTHQLWSTAVANLAAKTLVWGGGQSGQYLAAFCLVCILLVCCVRIELASYSVHFYRFLRKLLH